MMVALIRLAAELRFEGCSDAVRIECSHLAFYEE